MRSIGTILKLMPIRYVMWIVLVTSMHNIYISGPMSGIFDKNRHAFCCSAELLRTDGYIVVNPWELDIEDSRDTWEECLRRDIVALMKCTAVATLPGWKTSKGATLEIYIAKALKFPVHSVNYWRKHNAVHK
jgi:Domain of unknown function (DUF4406)